MAVEHAAKPLMRRIGRVTGAVAAVSMALVIGTVAGSRGTYALWNDSADLSLGSISSGMPGLAVTGFDGLNHEYTILPPSLSASATVTVTNTGDVPLHGFEAAATAGGGLTDLLSAVTLTFTPAAGGGAVGIDAWLDGMALAPGQAVQYTAHTSALSSALAGLLGEQSTTEVEVTALAGTSWLAAAGDAFTQSVGTAVDPPVEDFDMTFTLYGDNAHSMDVGWVAPSGLTHTDVFHLSVNGVLLPGTSSYNWPHQTVSTNDVPAQYRPGGPGETSTLVFTVTLNDDPTVIAQGTLFTVGGQGGDFWFATTAG